MLNLLAISVGNTHVRVGAFVDGKMELSVVVETAKLAGRLAPALADAHKLLAGKDDAVAVVGSVRPDETKAVVAAAAALGMKVLRAEQDLPIPIGRQLDRETIVGEDRLLNAAAAYDVLKQACVIVDAGTAITVDLVDGVGTFQGGAIGPGASLMLRALHEHTAQLPEVALVRPVEPVGHNTAEAMRTAAFHGLRGMVRELVEQYAQVLGAFPMVVATGGDAPLLFEDFDLIDRVVPELTLLGLKVTLAAANEEEG